MLRRFATLLLVLALATSPMFAAAADLPIRRIMVYKHGVAYFERSGSTAGVPEVVIEFKAGEMNDVLKSLTLLDRSGGRVSGVSYESSDPLDKQLQNFGFHVEPGSGITEVIDQFKGAKILVKTPGIGDVRGNILGARRTQQDKMEVQILTLLLDNGEIRSVPITESTSLRLEDPRMQSDLANYLMAIAGGQRRDLRALRIHPGTARDLSVGYVVEAPVWKSSYRLVFDSAKPGQALLQGWAIVDNPSNEDWKDVELSLVSGLPISFTQNLYAPHYMHRPEVPLPFEASVAPRVYEGALFDAKKDIANLPVNGRDYRQAAQFMAKTMNSTNSYQLNEAGAAGGRMEPKQAPVAGPVSADMLADSVAPATQGMELGELFEYRAEKSMTIPRHESAMIPFVQASIKTERILLFDPASGRQVPFDAVMLTNTSHTTLDGGAITLFEGDRYLGEALIETMKPGDSRPVSFAVDLGTRLTTAFDSHVDQAVSVKIHRGTVTTTSKNIEVKTYTIRNTDDKPRTLIIQHPVRQGWKFAADSPKPDQTTAQNYRFRISLPAKETTKLALTEEYEFPTTMTLNSLSSDQIAIYVRSKSIPPEAQQKLRNVILLKDRLAELENRVNQKQQEVNELRQDQDRLRSNINNLHGLPGQEAQVNRYAAKLTEQEKTMEALQASLAGERTSLRQTQQELDRTMTTMEI